MTAIPFVCLFLAQSFSPEVIEHAHAGAEALKQGRLQVAIQEFRQVTSLQPDSAPGHANLGEAYFQNHDYLAAIPELQRALQLNPQMMGTHQTLGVALLIEGNAFEALPHLEKNRTPELLGLAYLETGRLGSAIMALQAALERQPGDPDLLYYFGRATGLAAKRTAGQLAGPQTGAASPEGRKKEASWDIGKDVVQEVIRLQKALAERPDDPELLAEFRQAAELASGQAFGKITADSARFHLVAAERMAGRGSFPEAEREYSASLRLTPYAPGVHLALGNVLAAENKWPGAIAQFRAEAALRPLSAETLYRLGYALLQQGNAHDAQLVLSRADELRPDVPETLLALGQAFFVANDPAQAERLWMKVLTIDPSSELASQAHFGLAALYRKSGKTPDAERETAAYERMEKKDRQ